MTSVLKKADQRLISVARDASVLDAVRRMVENRVGAILVLEGNRAHGVFTERDLMAKVVLAGLDAGKTTVASVMTSPVQTVDAESDAAEALKKMMDGHFRHLPVTGNDGSVVGMLSIRHLMQDQIEELREEVGSLEAYMSFDGGGG